MRAARSRGLSASWWRAWYRRDRRPARSHSGASRSPPRQPIGSALPGVVSSSSRTTASAHGPASRSTWTPPPSTSRWPHWPSWARSSTSTPVSPRSTDPPPGRSRSGRRHLRRRHRRLRRARGTHPRTARDPRDALPRHRLRRAPGAVPRRRRAAHVGRRSRDALRDRPRHRRFAHAHARADGRARRPTADEELERSIALIEEHLGRPCDHFAYPKGVAGTPAADAAVRRRFRSAALAGATNPYGAPIRTGWPARRSR